MYRDVLLYNFELVKRASTSEEFYKRKQEIQTKLLGQRSYYYVLSGFVKMYVTTSCGHDLTLMVYRPGSLFSLMQLLSPTENTFHFQAFSDCKLLSIPERNFTEVLVKDYNTLRVLCGRYTLGMNRLSQRLAQAYYSSAKSRVISAICYFVKLCGMVEGNTVGFTIPITHEDIAGIAGLSRENTSRVLAKLKKDKVISIMYRKILIIDRNRLKVMAELDNKIINTL